MPRRQGRSDFTAGGCDPLTNLEWSPWIPLESGIDQYRASIPAQPGLYRVRPTSRPSLLAYIGQTGRSIRERTRELARQVNRPPDDPPWNDPHTAAPALWALRYDEGLEYEVSASPVGVSTATRQCMEDALLYRYRLEAGESTLANHGRFPAGWNRPSNRKRARRMERVSDGPDSAPGPSLAPCRPHGSPEDSDWLELAWSPMRALSEVGSDSPRSAGVYRLLEEGRVVYLGESSFLRDRIHAHRRRFRDRAMRASWVEMPDALPHQLTERETDLIGAYYLAQGEPPLLQYAGQR